MNKSRDLPRTMVAVLFVGALIVSGHSDSAGGRLSAVADFRRRNRRYRQLWALGIFVGPVVLAVNFALLKEWVENQPARERMWLLRKSQSLPRPHKTNALVDGATLSVFRRLQGGS